MWDISEHQKEMCKVLLENQKKMNENPPKDTDIASFKRISVPLVRRIYPQLLASKIMGVQPMTGPPQVNHVHVEPPESLVPPRFRTIDDVFTPSKDC